jgi:hypothetical protein
MPSTFLSQVFAQKLTGLWIHEPDLQTVPLNVHLPPDPTWRCAVVGSFHLDAAVQMHRAFAVLVRAEGSSGRGSKAGFSSANIAATCRLVVP